MKGRLKGGVVEAEHDVRVGSGRPDVCHFRPSLPLPAFLGSRVRMPTPHMTPGVPRFVRSNLLIPEQNKNLNRRHSWAMRLEA